MVGMLLERACSWLRLSQKKRFRLLWTCGMQVLFCKQTVAHTCHFVVLSYPAKINVMLKITAILQFLPDQSIKYEQQELISLWVLQWIWVSAPILLTGACSVTFHSYEEACQHLRKSGHYPQSPIMQSRSVPIFLPPNEWVPVPFLPLSFISAVLERHGGLLLLVASSLQQPFRLLSSTPHRITESQNVSGWKGPLWVI